MRQPTTIPIVDPVRDITNLTTDIFPNEGFTALSSQDRTAHTGILKQLPAFVFLISAHPNLTVAALHAVM